MAAEVIVNAVPNMDKQMTVEVLTASGCGRCQKVKTLVRGVIAELGDSRVRYREINVVEEIDYAVRLGVLSTPAIALNSELVGTDKLTAIRRQLLNEKTKYIQKIPISIGNHPIRGMALLQIQSQSS